MTLQAEEIARRFAALTPERRRAFLAKLADHGVDFAELPIVAAARGRPLPLSPLQRGLWLLGQRDPDSPAYNLGGLLTLRGPLDAVALAAALGDLVARHEPLRTIVRPDGEGEPWQHILPAAPLLLPPRPLDAAESERRARALAGRPFDLAREVPLRLELHRSGPQEHRLVLVLHHIAADGWSLGLLIEELGRCYAARQQGEAPVLPPLAVQYADFALWQRNWLEAGERERQLAFWKETLGEEPEPLALPFDRPRRPERSEAGAAQRFRLPPEASRALKALAQNRGATPFMAMLALFKLLLARCSGGEEIRVGAPLALRRRPETLPLIGYLTNLAVLRTAVDQRESFLELLARVREAVLAAEAGIDLPFDALVEALAPPRRPGVHPLFQVKCTEQAARAAELRFGYLTVTLQGLSSEAVHFDLSLDFTDRPEGFDCLLAYTSDLFEAATVARLAEDLQRLAEAVVEAPERPLAALLPVPPPAEAFGPRAAEAAPDVIAAWRAQVALRPEAVALRHEQRAYSRAQLAAAVEQLTARLQAAGVGRESVVCLQMGRSPEWVLGLLAVLSAGAAYLPLDPALPRERRAELIADSGAGWLLVEGPADDSFGCRVLTLSLEEAAVAQGPPPRPLPVLPQQAAYLIYTSGSTGRPKGVTVTRGGLAHYVRGVLARLALPEGARLAMASTVGADLGNTLLFGALCGGGELHLLDGARAFDPDRFADYMTAWRIDALKIVPSHLQALLQAGDPAAVLPRHSLVLGGEACGWPLLERIEALAPGCRVVNHYGPTETTIGVLCQPAGEAWRAAASLPIGRPLGEVTAVVLDPWLNPVPEGGTGELYLGGPGVARGYRGRPGQTAERFLPDPFGPPGARLYRSGDRVRRLPDGSLEFLGRLDDQVKIRGHRVEPGEVTAALRALAAVRDAAVIALDEGEGRLALAAYVVTPSAAALEAARAQLAERLPEPLLPSHWIRLDALPLTPNGKLDRRALPRPERPRPAGEPPRGATEEAVAAIWRSLLGVAAVGRHDRFTDLGGDSILSLKLLARLRKAGLPGARQLSLAELLSAGSLAELAGRLAPVARAEPDVVQLQRTGAGVPLFCLPGLIVNSTEFAGLVEALGGDRPVCGFVSHVYTEQRWRGFEVAALAGDYAAYVEKAAADGRCALLGWSSGGDLAFETARQLAGRLEVAFLGLVDVFESVPFRPSRVLAPTERQQARAAIEAWLARSRMAEHWRRLFALLDAEEQAALEEYALARGAEGLPLDGPDLASREFELWALLDKRLRAARWDWRPLDLPVQVWQAERSLTRSERLRDWSALAPVARRETVPGAGHLDIIHDAGFRRSVREALRAIDRPAP